MKPKPGGGCSSEGRAVAGSNPWLTQLHVQVSLSKILKPNELLMSTWHLAWQPLQPLCEWVNVISVVL